LLSHLFLRRLLVYIQWVLPFFSHNLTLRFCALALMLLASGVDKKPD
jgi:hypothetical protein